MQYTFLSKILNDEDSHLSRSHLYTIAQYLEFLPNEKDYLLLLRDHEAATNTDLKKYLFGKIEAYRKTKFIEAKFESGESSLMTLEMKYLLDPVTVVTHSFLMVEKYKDDPKRIANELGVTFEIIKQAILDLAQIDFIELEENSLKVKRVLQSRLHYPATHPLMQTYLKLMRNHCSSEIAKKPGSQKKSFYLTYVADEPTQQKIAEKFDKFITDINSMVRDAKNESVHQLNLDLFSWSN